MSFKPPVTGRVKSIKSKFENLNSLESLDISTPILNKYPRPSSGFHFKRSSTSIDLPSCKVVVNDGNTGSSKLVVGGRSKSSYLRKHNDAERNKASSGIDSFASKNRNLIVVDDRSDTLKPLKEIKENVEVRLSRHTSDPIKRSSIKRSPAFRVGDTRTTNLNHNNHKTKITPVIPKEFSEKFDELLKRCVTDSQNLQEAGLTDTLKAVLKQPLPTGPPPKKPPRTFIDSPTSRDNIQPIQLFQNNVANSEDKQNVLSKTSVSAISPTSELQQKIDLLENQLVLKSAPASKSKTSSSSKEKNPFSSSFLNCIPCSSTPVYDTMVINRKATAKTVTTKKHRPSDGSVINTNIPLTSRSPPPPSLQTHYGSTKKKNVSEHIYMEPFAHLRSSNNNNNISPNSESHDNNISVPECSIESSQKLPSISMSNVSNNEMKVASLANGSPDNESIDSSVVSCTSCAADDHSISDSGDIHYMCASIENKIKSSDSDSNSNENEPNPLTLSNTYDEINILVNAAFGQHKTTDTMGNAIETSESSSASASTTEASNQQKTAIKLYRTLTEKRKDYVRRISAVKPVPDNISSYGSLHQTFKSPVFRTFSIESENNSNADSVSADEKHSKSLPRPSKISERIQQFNENCKKELENQKEIHANDNKNVLPSKNMNVCDIENVVLNDSEAMADDDVERDDDDDSPKLFQVCLLIGYNNSTRQAYIKSKFPSDEDVPPNIEQLVFPSQNLMLQTRSNQDYSLVLTDNSGYHVYGYCRRVLPESCEICLPLAYCIISEVKAPGFYFKILKEIESRHGQAEFQTKFLLQNLQNRPIPDAGKFLHLKLPLSPKPKTISMSNHKITPKRLSLEVNPKWLTESAAQAAFSCAETTNSESILSKKERSGQKSLVQEFEEKKQEKSANAAPFDLSLINRSLLSGIQRGAGKCDEIFVTRPNDLRLESTELSDLYKALGPNLLISVFSSLLLERKVILFTENISILSSCVLGLQTLLYPFQWQHALITVLPQCLTEICQAPIPVLAGMLEPISFDIEDGIVINLNNRSIVQKCGDETTILPTTLSSSLKVSLEMVDMLDQGKMLSSVLIAEAFLRFFVELFVGYKHKYYDKHLFIESHPSQTYRLFLEWFVETAMFRHFVHQKFAQPESEEEMDSTTEPKFYDLFDARVLKSENKSNSTQQNMEVIMKNCRVINKKTKTFKDRFKEVFSSSSSSGSSSSNNNSHGNEK